METVKLNLTIDFNVDFKRSLCIDLINDILTFTWSAIDKWAAEYCIDPNKIKLNFKFPD